MPLRQGLPIAYKVQTRYADGTGPNPLLSDASFDRQFLSSFSQQGNSSAGVIKRILITLFISQFISSGLVAAQSPLGPADVDGLSVRHELDLIAIDGGMIQSDGSSGELLAEFEMLGPGMTNQVDGTCDGICSGPGLCGPDSSPPLASHWTPFAGLHSRIGAIDLSRFHIGERFRVQRTRDRGIGYERVMYAPSVLDTAIQVPHVGFRLQLDRGLEVPDRAEYFWGSGSESSAETDVNAQDLSVRLAVGNEKLMALTQYTLRSIDPGVKANTTGMGDMVVGAQAMLVEGKQATLATILRTFIATGSSSKGLGTGHTSLEYGLLGRKCLSPETYLFGEAKYWMPIAGTSGVAGDVLSTGWGISTIASESDVFAFLPTLELRTLSFLFGGQTPPGTLTTQRIDGETAVELYPGARFVFDRQSDLGLIEFGFAGGVTFADDEWFDSRLVLDLRFSH